MIVLSEKHIFFIYNECYKKFFIASIYRPRLYMIILKFLFFMSGNFIFTILYFSVRGHNAIQV